MQQPSAPSKVPAKAQQIKRIAESIITLPTLPTVVSKMIELVDNPRTSAASLARLISTDQSLTARVLKLANSAYYGFSREISTVNMAIVVLGFNTVKDMGLSLSVLDVFKQGGVPGAFDVAKFWEHSIGCGVACRMLARKAYGRLVGEAFVAGLLHDIGKLVVNQYAHPDFEEIMVLVHKDGIGLDQAEEQVMGTSHAQIGGWLAEKWKLPTVICSSIEFHHKPWDAPQEKDPGFVGLVMLADLLCHSAGIGHSGRASAPLPDARMWDLFGSGGVQLTAAMMDDLKSDFLVEFDQAETFVSFMKEQ
jgi:HD-like signal output (HDOD) protein